MGFLDSLGCCASRPVRPRKQANRARGSGGGGGGGGASTVVDAALPAFVWSTGDVVGDEATRTPMAEIQVGARYFSEDGRHFVKDSEGNLVVTRPSERGESVLAFDEWMEEQKRAGSRQLAAHLSFGESAELASRMKSKALRRYTIPELVDGEGTLLDRRTLHALWQTVPPMCRVQDWVLVYGVKQHGAALSTLLRRASGIDTTLLVVKTTDGRLFGGFATSIWAEKLEGGSGSPVFFGRGTSWLYRFPVEGSAGIEQFSWSRADQQFQFCGKGGFGLGAAGSGDGYGLWLSADLSSGSSAPSSTFTSPCLADGGNDVQHFEVMGLELWGFDCADALARNAGAGIIQTNWRGAAHS